uniref:AlNc14C351G10903 protein n=1 Tax=Albugo laibachii Nc14 TaxID=890382 RepID=F0WXF2_9STRA|nr:AlNc14C351G10903 [Albugo laibachii Nc14]|eukprot:CCA26144.1 AlNc14C351G10903 [Albugo laibachii Nc14]
MSSFSIFHMISTTGLLRLSAAILPEVIAELNKVLWLRNEDKAKCMAVFEIGFPSKTAILYYQIEQMRFGLHPSIFSKVFFAKTTDERSCIEKNLLAMDEENNPITSVELSKKVQEKYTELYNALYAIGGSLGKVKSLKALWEFKLLMLFYYQQFTRMVKYEKKCAELEESQASRWQYNLKTDVSALADDAKYYFWKHKFLDRVESEVDVNDQKATVRFQLDRDPLVKLPDLLQVFNKSGVLASVVIGAERFPSSQLYPDIKH